MLASFILCVVYLLGGLGLFCFKTEHKTQVDIRSNNCGGVAQLG